MFSENARGDLGVLLDELEDWVSENILAGVRKVHQRLEARVRLAEHAVAVTRDDTSRLEGVPEVSADVLVGELGSDLVLHGEDPAKNFLCGETVERAGKTKETGRVTEEGVAEGAADEVGSVGGNVAALVVSVKSEVETEEVMEVTVLGATLAEELGEVVRPILGRVELLSADDVDFVRAENEGRDTGDLCEKGDGIVECGLPVVSLVDALFVELGKFRLGVESGGNNRDLGHRVHVAGERLDQVEDVVREVRFLSQLARKGTDLAGRRHLAGQKQPKHGLREHLSASGALGQLLLAVLDGLAVEANALICVENRALPEHALEATHATNDAGNLDIADNLIALLLHLSQQLALGRDDGLEGGFKVGLGRSITAAGDCLWKHC